MRQRIWFERVWAKRDGRWQWLSHRTVWGPHPSPAGVDPTQVSPDQATGYVPTRESVSEK